MSSLRFLILSALGWAAVLGASAGSAPPESLRVLLEESGSALWVRYPFSATSDLVIRVGKGGPSAVINFTRTRLVPRENAMTPATCEEGEIIHANADDATPWRINGTHIGGNHGSENLFQLQAPTHGRTVADIGTGWRDAAGEIFYIVDIPDADTLQVSSANHGGGPIWEFAKHLDGTTLTSEKDGTVLPFKSSTRAQFHPACRIRSQQFLADGKARLIPGKVTECRFLEIVDDYDIINPGSAVADIVAHPGVKPNPVAPQLDAVLNNRIAYRFFPNGAVTVSHKATALQPFNLVFMGFIQSTKLERGKYDTHEYYVPKTLPFAQDGATYDFSRLQDFRQPPKTDIVFSEAAKNVAARNDLPNRFIQFLGRTVEGETKREIGYALGYSPLHGLTALAERSRQTSSAGRINDGSAKSYPYAIDQKIGNPIAAGTVFECEAYCQYFDASAFPQATCMYWHRDGDVDLLWVDYQEAVERDTLALPTRFTGRKFRVVEKSPTVTVNSQETIPAEGLSLSVAERAAYLVLAIEDVH